MQFIQLESKVNKENINKMVVQFYTTILEEDNDVARAFIEHLGEDITTPLWQEHLDILTNFWLKQYTGDESIYNGNPLKAHFGMPLNHAMFRIWLSYFCKTVDSIYTPEIAQFFKNKANDIANNFMRILLTKEK
jgi:truncated hemoglobin YjbI